MKHQPAEAFLKTAEPPVVQILLTAYSRISAGWCQGKSYDGRGGMCLGAALWHHDRLSAYEDACKADAYVFALTKEPSHSSIAYWNDAPERTKEEVLAVLMQAAAKARADFFAGR